MKSRTAMVVLMLCAAVAVFGSEYEPTIASGSSPLFAASLERAVSGLKGERPKQPKSAANRAVRGAAAVAEDTSGWNCTQFEGCWSFVTQGGISCDYSLCEGCPGQTAYGNYTCSNVINCGVFPTQNAEPTCVAQPVPPEVGHRLTLHVEAQVLPEKVPQKLLDVLLQLSCCAVLQPDPQVEPNPEQVGPEFCVGKTPHPRLLLHV